MPRDSGTTQARLLLLVSRWHALSARSPHSNANGTKPGIPLHTAHRFTPQRSSRMHYVSLWVSIAYPESQSAQATPPTPGRASQRPPTHESSPYLPILPAGYRVPTLVSSVSPYRAPPCRLPVSTSVLAMNGFNAHLRPLCSPSTDSTEYDYLTAVDTP